VRERTGQAAKIGRAVHDPSSLVSQHGPGHPSYSFAGDPECKGDVSESANNEAPHSPIESNSPHAPRPRWRESNDVRLQQRHCPESSAEERPSSMQRNRWVSTPRSEWQSTSSPVGEQDKVVSKANQRFGTIPTCLLLLFKGKGTNDANCQSSKVPVVDYQHWACQRGPSLQRRQEVHLVMIGAMAGM
jgi:hypothetical protein